VEGRRQSYETDKEKEKWGRKMEMEWTSERDGKGTL
jgi:hypothetical protein